MKRMWLVDTSEAPKDHPDLAGTVEDIQRKLCNPRFVKAIAIHEVAHSVYWGFLERETKPDYAIRIRLNSSGVCCVEYAAMILVNPTEPKSFTGLELAKAHVAGTAATQILVPGCDPGDTQDLDNLQKDLLAVTEASLNEIRLLWELARSDVQADILAPNSQVRADIERQAVAFERTFRHVSQVR